MARNPQREDRRRRVLRDESRPKTTRTRRRTSSSDRAYGELALEKNQPRVTDYLPTRGMSLFYVFSLALRRLVPCSRCMSLEKRICINTRKSRHPGWRWLVP